MISSKIKYLLLYSTIAIFIFTGNIYGKSSTAKVTFFLGNPEITYKNKKKTVKIGLKIPLKSKIKTPGASRIVILYKGRNFIIQKGKNIKLSKYINRGIKNRSFAGKLLRKMVKTPYKGNRKTTSAAVRADEYSEDSISWSTEDDNIEPEIKPSKINKYWKLIDNKKYRKIVKILKNPNTGSEWYIKGVALLNLRKDAEAVKAFVRATKENIPTGLYLQSGISAASIYMQFGEYTKSLNVLGGIIRKVEEKKIPVEVWYMLAKNSEFTANNRDAGKYKSLLIKHFPGSEYIY